MYRWFLGIFVTWFYYGCLLLEKVVCFVEDLS